MIKVNRFCRQKWMFVNKNESNGVKQGEKIAKTHEKRHFSDAIERLDLSGCILLSSVHAIAQISSFSTLKIVGVTEEMAPDTHWKKTKKFFWGVKNHGVDVTNLDFN